jgi:hypothetical protein
MRILSEVLGVFMALLKIWLLKKGFSPSKLSLSLLPSCPLALSVFADGDLSPIQIE